LRLFKQNTVATKSILLDKTEVMATIHFSGNKKQKFELTWGSSFLSQTSRNWNIPQGATKIELYNQKGNLTRAINTP
jgi:hypothetical protein